MGRRIIDSDFHFELFVKFVAHNQESVNLINLRKTKQPLFKCEGVQVTMRVSFRFK